MKHTEIDAEKLSPGMRQWYDIKIKHEDSLLFFRLGDFYELFFEDALLASRELELTLTSKSCGLDERVPMCGVPHHAVKSYIETLINKDYKVAVCEQLEDPKQAKGMVKRDVIEVVTKGTMVDLEFLDSSDFNYIGSLIDLSYLYLLTYLDLSTGKMYATLINYNNTSLINEVLRLNLKEIVVKKDFNLEIINVLKENYSIRISYNDNLLENNYSYLYENIEDERIHVGVKHLLYYISVDGLKDLSHIKNVEIVNLDDRLKMDVHTIRNLELIETLRLKERRYSLIWLLDKTKTAMGSRTLKNWLMNPLKDKNEINKRLDYIETLNKEYLLREDLRTNINEVYDLERLCGKVICSSLNARDVLQIKNSLNVLPTINEILKSLKFNYKLNEQRELYELLESAIYLEPPVSIKEGYLIKEGYSKELDELKSIRSGGKEFISSIESSLKESTGITNLHVGYNKVFGYYIEVSKSNSKKVMDEFGWERRQTLTNAERFITPELKEKEALILNAEEKIVELEYNLFMNIKEEIKKCIFDIKETAESLGEIDTLASLSVVSDELGFTRPIIHDKKSIEIINGRHPVVEAVSNTVYVKNDCIMDEETNTLLITGPNMSGKSTYMRQLAIIVILASMGSFVPADKCTIPVFDAIYTRIGASDDLVSGESTFMVEMLEAKRAITSSTEHSLILFDELGRGTATYDGMSLAEAILEYISSNIKCKTLFSTHYHELTSLEDKDKSIKNVHVDAIEENNTVTFLHKIKCGPVDKSYGIHVARLAGMPESLLKRANEILKFYESGEKKNDNSSQITFDFEEKNDELKEYIDSIDPLNITPIEAMNILFTIKEKNRK